MALALTKNSAVGEVDCSERKIQSVWLFQIVYESDAVCNK